MGDEHIPALGSCRVSFSCLAKRSALSLGPKVQASSVVPHHTSNSSCAGERRGRHERRRGIFTSFSAEYPNGFLWICYLFTAKKVKSDSAAMFIHFLPRLSVWGLSGVEFSKAALVHLEADFQLISCGLLQAAIRCQHRSGSSQISQCSSKVLHRCDKVFQVYESI